MIRLKSIGAIHRCEFVPRDPWRSNELSRCMPRWQALATRLLASVSAENERRAISGGRSGRRRGRHGRNAIRVATRVSDARRYLLALASAARDALSMLRIA